MRSPRISVGFTLAALAMSNCRAVAVPLPSSTATAAPIASNPWLPTTAFNLSRDAAVLVDALAADPFDREPGRGGSGPYERLASLLTAEEATALLQHESATVRAYMALHVVRRLARYDALRQVLRDGSGITDETTDVTDHSTVARETARAVCDAAESDPRARSLIESVLGDATLRPAWGEAVRCVARHHIPGARERALALVDDGDKEIQESAFFALEDAATDADATRLLGILKDGDAGRRYRAAAVLERLAGPAVVETLEHVARKDADREARAAAARAYAHHAEARKDVLEALVADAEELVAEYTVDGLARRGGPDDLALMVPYLRKAAWLDSLDVMDAFERPPRPEWIVPMRKLAGAPASGVREAALKWLGRAHDSAALPLARKALRSKDALDQLGAISAVASLGARDSIPALVALLDHKNMHIRLASARALTVLHAQRAYPKVARAAQHETSYHRQSMLEACDALRNGREVAVDAP